MKRAAMTSCALLLFALFSAGCIQAQITPQAPAYTSLSSALAGEAQLSSFAAIIPEGLKSVLADPTTQMTLFAPTNKAVADMSDTLLSYGYTLADVAPAIVPYHLALNASIVFRDDLVLRTFLGLLNVTNTTTALTIRANNADSWYIGGMAPGAVFKIASRIKAGNSDLYVLNAVLLPPSAAFDVDLTVRQAIDNDPLFTVVSTLLAKDTTTTFRALTDPTLAVTMMLPTDAAWNTFFAYNNITLSQFAGTAVARRILLNHVFPYYPVNSTDFAIGDTRARSPANDTIIFTRTQTDITVRGDGNTQGVRVIDDQGIAGMSGIWTLGGIILPKLTASTPTTGK